MRALLAIFLVFCTNGFPNLGHASDRTVSTEQALAKINLSGRQRMLSQRLTKAACFMSMGIEEDYHRNQIETAQAKFNDTLLGLYLGDDSVGLIPETSEVIKQRLQDVHTLWSMMDLSMTYVGVAGPGNVGELWTLSVLSLMVLGEANSAVTAIEAEYGEGAIDEALAKTTNVAGRQRMLSQRMAKETCLVTAKVNPEINRKNLKKSMDLFESSLEALWSGDETAGIVPPTSEIQSQQLSEVKQIWLNLKKHLTQVLDEERAQDDVLGAIVTLNDFLLVEMNKVVGMY